QEPPLGANTGDHVEARPGPETAEPRSYRRQCGVVPACAPELDDEAGQRSRRVAGTDLYQHVLGQSTVNRLRRRRHEWHDVTAPIMLELAHRFDLVGELLAQQGAQPRHRQREVTHRLQLKGSVNRKPEKLLAALVPGPTAMVPPVPSQ